MEPGPNTVILVEDDDDLRIATAQAFALSNLTVQAFDTARAALEAVTPQFPGVVVTDIRMPEIDGRQLFRRIREIDPDIPVIFITGHADIDEAVDALHEGAYDFVAKPFANERLLRPVLNALEKRRLVMANAKLRLTADEAQLDWPLIGQSPAIERLRRTLRDLAKTDIDVLISGETGAGKELVARALHSWGPRQRHAFVAVNCAGLSAGLSDSELFGHELGAFPGAVRRRVGRIEQAHRGTLFLDELDAMPIGEQPKLLRFLEEREISPIGSNETRTVDVRIVAAVKVDPSNPEVVRRDLFHRLNAVNVHVPPLRERRSDIPLLFAHFLARAADRFGREPPPINDQVRRTLLDHDWPGNVRELAHFAERVALDLVQQPDGTHEDDGQGGLRSRVEHFEADLIRDALTRFDGDVRSTIEALMLPRKTFYDKVQRYQIDLAEFRKR